jgi:hypothetical protein
VNAPAVQWVTGSPLWGPAADDPAAMQRPALLRYASDTFMDDLTADVADGGAAVATRVAVPRSYRRRPVGAPSGWDGAPDRLKLFQPAHGHFNLVVASLVCRVPGLPDRALDSGEDESAGFVLRRLVADPSGSGAFVEAAWTQAGGSRGWGAVTGTRWLAEGEEVLPLVPVRTRGGDPRRLLVGLVPTSSGDTFKGAGVAQAAIADRDPAGNPVDPRMAELETRVLGPLQTLIDADLAPGAEVTGDARTRTIAGATATAMEASRFLLLDLAELLSTHLPVVWDALVAGAARGGPAAAALYQVLATSPVTAGGPTVRTALLGAWEQRLRIEAEAEPPPDLDVDLRDSPFDAATLRPVLLAAVAESPPPAQAPAPGPAPDGADPAAMPKLGGDALYLVRCVFRRPNCVPLPLDLLSEPTEPFRIAGFYDLDAPARTIRVELPVRTSIADLRKYPKNVGFMLSDQLREQMCRVSDIKSTLSGQLACGDTIDIGMLCSFSIPIITICALIVLLLFVNLLNIVFWWLPFFRMCLPILLPGKRT